MEFFLDLGSFVSVYFSKIGSPLGIWCLYDVIGLRAIFLLISSALIAFSIPNFLNDSVCNPDKDSYIKVMFAEKKKKMKIQSAFVVFFSVLTIFFYLLSWAAFGSQHLCATMQASDDFHKYGVYVWSLPMLNILTIFVGYFAIRNQMYCDMYKSK